MTSAGKAEAARAEQMAYCFCVVSTLRCQWHQLFVGTNTRPHDTFFQKHRGQNDESHLELQEFKAQLCQYSTAQLWFHDLPIHWQRRAGCCFCLSQCEQSSQYLVERGPWTQQAKRRLCRVMPPFQSALTAVEHVPWCGEGRAVLLSAQWLPQESKTILN